MFLLRRLFPCLAPQVRSRLLLFCSVWVGTKTKKKKKKETKKSQKVPNHTAVPAVARPSRSAWLSEEECPCVSLFLVLGLHLLRIRSCDGLACLPSCPACLPPSSSQLSWRNPPLTSEDSQQLSSSGECRVPSRSACHFPRVARRLQGLGGALYKYVTMRSGTGHLSPALPCLEQNKVQLTNRTTSGEHRR